MKDRSFHGNADSSNQWRRFWLDFAVAVVIKNGRKQIWRIRQNQHEGLSLSDVDGFVSAKSENADQMTGSFTIRFN